MKWAVTLILFVLPVVGSTQSVEVEWVEEVEADFGFTKNWSYPMWTMKNQWGQVSCDGWCEPEAEALKGEGGKIPEENLAEFYSYVDTTHRHHTINCRAKAYEFAGTNFIGCVESSSGTYKCETEGNQATHSSLILDIDGDICTPSIDLVSIMPDGNAVFPCKEGWIKVDKAALDRDIFKASFSFLFSDTKGGGDDLTWEGEIMSPIERSE